MFPISQTLQGVRASTFSETFLRLLLTTLHIFQRPRNFIYAAVTHAMPVLKNAEQKHL